MPVRISVFCPTWPSVVAVSWKFAFCSDQTSQPFWPRSSETDLPELASALLFLCWSREGGGEKSQPKPGKICWGVKYIRFGPTVWAVSCLSCITLSHMIFPFPSCYTETKSKSMGNQEPRLSFVSRVWYWIWTLPRLDCVQKQDLGGTKSALVPQGAVCFSFQFRAWNAICLMLLFK